MRVAELDAPAALKAQLVLLSLALRPQAVMSEDSDEGPEEPQSSELVPVAPKLRGPYRKQRALPTHFGLHSVTTRMHSAGCWCARGQVGGGLGHERPMPTSGALRTPRIAKFGGRGKHCGCLGSCGCEGLVICRLGIFAAR